MKKLIYTWYIHIGRSSRRSTINC